ncbi:MAG: FAD:protein FMN transferase [Chloroflexi bacterium]|nr:FAD:protein FMN transferase [Chloroflexota bacterium]
MREILFRAMGCEIFCALDTNHPRATERLERVPAMFEAWEQTLSRFRPTSELSQLNARSGQNVRVSETLWRVLKLARRAAELSDGLVVPTLLDALLAAGYDRSFDVLGVPNSSATATLLVLTRANTWELNDMTHTVTLTPGTHLDLNGVAKGWAVEQTAMYLGELGPALVDAGGDMIMTAPCANGEPWYIGVEDAFTPEQENDALPVLAIGRGATATSGRSYRKWSHDGKPMHHLINPRTGMPAVTDVLNATVVAPTILQAEVAAKVALILGSTKGRAWIEARPQLAALFILENGNVVTTWRMEEYIA